MVERMEWFDITDEDVKRRESALHTLLAQFDVPNTRKDTARIANLRWLNRNLSVSNSEHPMHDTAKNILKWLLRWHEVGKVTVGDR
jgi:hypothetical protein